MILFTRKELETLSVTTDGYHISLFQPTHSSGNDLEENPIRFKNLLKKIEEALLKEDFKKADIKSILEPLYLMQNNDFFWRHQSKGLALFLSADLYRHYNTNHTFQEQVVVGHRFHLKPLLPLLSREDNFYILALSQEHCRLIQCNRDLKQEVPLIGLEMVTSKIIGGKDAENRNFNHLIGKGGKGDQMWSTGESGSAEKELIKRSFRAIDQVVRKKLGDTTDPLIVATVDSNFPLYKEVNTYPNLFEAYLPGSPDREPMDVLHEKGFTLIRPYFKKQRTQSEELYRKLNGTGRTSIRIEEIVTMALEGKVETLFVARDVEQWGNFDELNHTVTLHDTFENGDEDLLSYASIHTLIHKGEVIPMMPEYMPDKSNIAAILRY